MTDVYPKTARNKVKRLPERGHYDAATIYPIVDAALICHVGFALDGQPYVIPTLHARRDDTILLHGAKGSRLLRHIQSGGEVCITITLIDGIVLARSVFPVIADDQLRLQALEAFTERLIPGRWQDARLPNALELKQTTIVAVPIASASAKLRTGPPGDEDDDLDLPVWAGILPIRQIAGAPVADPQLKPGVELPDYIRDFDARG